MYCNIRFSPTGGTEKAADIPASRLCGEYSVLDLCIERLKKISCNGQTMVRRTL